LACRATRTGHTTHYVFTMHTWVVHIVTTVTLNRSYLASHRSHCKERGTGDLRPTFGKTKLPLFQEAYFYSYVDFSIVLTNNGSSYSRDLTSDTSDRQVLKSMCDVRNDRETETKSTTSSVRVQA
jgi:hypothetical protein